MGVAHRALWNSRAPAIRASSSHEPQPSCSADSGRSGHHVGARPHRSGPGRRLADRHGCGADGQSITLLGWFVLAAHLDRVRIRRDKSADFDALVRLCRDLGAEAEEKSRAHLPAITTGLNSPPPSAAGVAGRVAAWRSEMTVIYVCLNEVPHYEVRNPAFSTALTRLWLAVDARNVAP